MIDVVVLTSYNLLISTKTHLKQPKKLCVCFIIATKQHCSNYQLKLKFKLIKDGPRTSSRPDVKPKGFGSKFKLYKHQKLLFFNL